MRRLVLLLFACGAPLVAGCRNEMYDQWKKQPLQGSRLFPDGRASRPSVPGTVPRGQRVRDELLETGLVDGQPATVFPFPVDAAVLERGEARYGIFCAPCHDALGTGEGMIVKRGMKRPTSFHDERLREAPPGYFFDVITNGFGAMYDYSDRIPPRDRWAIVAYIQALQLSQRATLEDVPADARGALEEERP